MNKLTSRIISGVLASIFAGQVLIYGDGACQGILHAETISEVSTAIEENSKKVALAKEFESAVSGIGSIDYFGSNENISLMSAEEGSGEIEFSSNLTISGYVQRGGYLGIQLLM